MISIGPAHENGSPEWRRSMEVNHPIGCALHSAGGAPGLWNRWSYLPDAPLLALRCDSEAGGASLSSTAGVIRRWADPLEALAWMATAVRKPPTDGPPFKGGWIGYLSYDLGRMFEALPALRPPDPALPLYLFTFHDNALAEDGAGLRHSVRCTHDFGARPLPRVPPALAEAAPDGLRSTFTRAGYERAVTRAIEYVSAGDVFQVNLSQRFTAPLRESPERIYRRLRSESADWFAAYLGYGDHALLCNSPELFLRVTPDRTTGKRRVVTRPIKGTRPRLPGMDIELRDSAKDQAELNMIIDLERNDLGRVCEVGSVRVTEPRTVEAHPTVYHGAAAVGGVLRDDVGFVDLLRATFPGGSVTGAPKIRAMQIIEQLEPVRRGPYCGAIGYLSADGHLEFNVAIRTMVVKGGLVHVPVGGGIVADSDPAAEYEETLVKARAMFRALGISLEDARGL